MSVAIIDYGMGNPGSIKSMLGRLGVASKITSDPDEIVSADKLVLPGVGAFDAGMRNLHERGLVAVLNERVRARGVPVLGVCLGMQLMAGASEEGVEPGLSWINAKAKRFSIPFDSRLKVPHMGWTDVAPRKPSPLIGNAPVGLRFYFVHSYHVVCEDTADVLLEASHGGDFVAGFERGNVLGVQFHPEKSHKYGLKLYENFVARY